MRGKQWNRWIICLLGFTLLPVSCTITSRQPPSRRLPEAEYLSVAGVPGTKQAGKADQILFITMRMAHDPKTGNREIQVQDLLRAAGTIKKKASQPALSAPYLSCILFSGQVRLDSILLPHPLYRQVEYVNDQHQLTRKAFSADEAEFFIRFQQGQAQGLKIEERLPDAAPKDLITIKL